MKNKSLCAPDGNNQIEDQEGEENQDTVPVAAMYDETDRCPICLNCLLQQEVGFPENCLHVFCMTCILKWAEIVPFCPVDRKPFQAVYRIKDCVKFYVTHQTQTQEENCGCDNLETSCCTVDAKCDIRDAGIGPLKARVFSNCKRKNDTSNVDKDEKKTVAVKLHKIFHSAGKSLLIFYKFR